MTALQGKGVIGTVFRNRIVTAFFMALAMTLAVEHAIAADPIARIGLIGRAQLGLSTRLESTGQNDPAARFSWQLTQRPKKSKAKLNDNNAARASFVPDVPVSSRGPRHPSRLLTNRSRSRSGRSLTFR